MDPQLIVSVAVVAAFVALVWWSTPDRVDRRRARRAIRSRWQTRPPS